MSCTTILSVSAGKSPEDIKELQNSHGSAPVVWNELCKKYFGTEDHSYMGHISRLWPLYKDQTVPQHHRSVLMMTYDRAYVSKKHFQQASDDIRKFLKDFPPNERYVNHWREIAEIYDAPDQGCENIGLYCTSVSDNPFLGYWNEEKDDYDIIDWGETFEIYDELDGLVAER